MFGDALSKTGCHPGESRDPIHLSSRVVATVRWTGITQQRLLGEPMGPGFRRDDTFNFLTPLTRAAMTQGSALELGY